MFANAVEVSYPIFYYSNYSKYILIVAPTDPVPLNLNTILDPSLNTNLTP
jgi:hypothetical protein